MRLLLIFQLNQLWRIDFKKEEVLPKRKSVISPWFNCMLLNGFSYRGRWNTRECHLSVERQVLNRVLTCVHPSLMTSGTEMVFSLNPPKLLIGSKGLILNPSWVWWKQPPLHWVSVSNAPKSLLNLSLAPWIEMCHGPVIITGRHKGVEEGELSFIYHMGNLLLSLARCWWLWHQLSAKRKTSGSGSKNVTFVCLLCLSNAILGWIVRF